MKKIFKSSTSLANYEFRNANGKFGKRKINTSLKIVQESAKIPEVYKDEYELLITYKNLMDAKDHKNKIKKEKRVEAFFLVVKVTKVAIFYAYF